MSKSYAEMKSQGSFVEATQGGDNARAARMGRRDELSEATKAQRAEAMAWAAEHLPESVGRWQSYAADAVIRNDRKGLARSVPDVKRTVARVFPYLPKWIKEYDEAKGDA